MNTLVYMGFDVEIHPSVIVGEFSKISDGTHIDEDCVLGSFVRTGKNCRIGKRVHIKCQSVITKNAIIEDNVFIGGGVMFLSEDLEGEHSKTIIRQGAYLGARSVIAAGVTVGVGAVVGAMAFVNRDVPAFSTVVGVPAKELKRD
jgi:UDP-2-acetamido-3-amino-2,3-dideoxy-glucuronate N-acetyltransferase